MKKIFAILFVLVAVIFMYINISKKKNVDDTHESSYIEVEDKERIRTFWEIYRSATSSRLAGNVVDAIAQYEQALKINDAHEDALYYLGNLYYTTGRWREARECWITMIKINPKTPRAHFQLGHLYLNRESPEIYNIDNAETEFTRTLELNKEETAPVLYLGQIAIIRNKLDDARDFLNSVLGSNPASIEANYLKGYIAWKNHKLEDATYYLNNAIKYSRSTGQKDQVIGEGDTRPDNAMAKPINQSVLNSFLGPLKERDSGFPPDEIDEEYRKLDAFLITLR